MFLVRSYLDGLKVTPNLARFPGHHSFHFLCSHVIRRSKIFRRSQFFRCSQIIWWSNFLVTFLGSHIVRQSHIFRRIHFLGGDTFQEESFFQAESFTQADSILQVVLFFRRRSRRRQSTIFQKCFFMAIAIDPTLNNFQRVFLLCILFYNFKKIY